MLHAPSLSRRGSILLLLLLSIITVTVVIAFAFLRSMQMSRGTTLVQRKDDLARLAAEMGMQHAMAVCVDEFGMTSEVRDDSILTPVSRIDSPSQVTFASLSPATGNKSREVQHYDVGTDAAFANLFHFFMGGTRTVGFSSGEVIKPGYTRWFEANRFGYNPTSKVFDPSTYDQYDAAAPNPAVVATRFPPVDPFVRGATPVKANPSDHPLFLDADCRPVNDASDARFRLRYAVNVQDMSGSAWLNTEMPWLSEAEQTDARTAYAESIYAVGYYFGSGRGDSMESIFRGYGAVGNVSFVNGQPHDWPARGGGPMWFRNPDSNSNRALHCVQGSPFMNWNDPGGKWIGSAILSFNDLGFAVQPDNAAWQEAGEVKDNESRVRGDAIAQFMATPFGKPQGAATDNPWAVNALIVAPRLLEAMVSAYIPPAVRAVAVNTETCQPLIQRIDAKGNITKTFESKVEAGVAEPVTWNIPSDAELTAPGFGPDLFTESFLPQGKQPFLFPTTPMRNYWTTPVGSPSMPGSWRPSYDSVTDVRPNAQRYPGELFFSDPVKEAYGQAMTNWRWLDEDGVTACNGVATMPRQVMTDPLNDSGFVPPAWGLGSYTITDIVTHGGKWYRCIQAHMAKVAVPPATEPDPDAEPGVGAKWGSYWKEVRQSKPYPAKDGVDHLGRHIIFYKADDGAIAPIARSNFKYLSVSGDNLNWADEFIPGLPMNPDIAGPGKDGRITPYRGTSTVIYQPSPGVIANGEKYPVGSWTVAERTQAAKTPPSLRGAPPFNVNKPDGWKVTQSSAGGWGSSAEAAFPNSYYNRLYLAFGHAVAVAQVANLAWANHIDARSQAFFSGTNSRDALGVVYSKTPDVTNSTSSYIRKGTASWKNAVDPKVGDQWDPSALDFATIAQLDRQFVANLGESFDRPGHRLPSDAEAERPPRYLRTRGGMADDASPTSFQMTSRMSVAEYHVTNNIRTLLTPIDVTSGGALLTGFSTDPQTGANVPPHKLWLLDEWNVAGEATYIPGNVVDIKPSKVARARAKMMERVLNDWRLSFFGSEASYVTDFRPKDFDGDGMVFCSGYLTPAAADLDCGLTCWKPADVNGDGPGTGSGLTPFSVTGCLTITRSRQFKIHVRGELYDNFLDRAVSEQYLESDLLLDPDGNVSRSGIASGLEDSVLIMQRPIHSYYHGLLNRAYP